MGLFDRDPEVERMKDVKDLDGLIKALENGEPKVRRQAAGALGEIGDPME